jgi:hypothetical protein
MRTVLIAALLLGGCGKSAEERARADSEAEDKKAGNPDPKPTPSSQDKDKPPEPKLQPKKEKAAEEPPPHADPKTPVEIDENRKWAMNKGKSKEAIRYCEMANLDAKSDPQVRLGCTFAACREKDEVHAKLWGKDLEKKFKDNAIKPCAQVGITLN